MMQNETTSAFRRALGGLAAGAVAFALSSALVFADPVLSAFDEELFDYSQEYRGPQLPADSEGWGHDEDEMDAALLGSSFSASATYPGSAEAMVETALAEPDGYPEGGYYNKYNSLFGHGGYDWCGCFITWCARTAGISTDAIPNICLTTAMVQFYQEQGVWHGTSYTPKAGDLIFFDSGGSGYVSHVGLVVGVEDGYILTKEGNTKNGQVGSTKNLKVGSTGNPEYSRHIYGFASPKYAVCSHSSWHAENVTYQATDSDVSHTRSYTKVCDDCGATIGTVTGEAENCTFVWRGVKLVCSGCGSEFVAHAANADYVSQTATRFYSNESLGSAGGYIASGTVVHVSQTKLVGNKWVGMGSAGNASGWVRLSDFKYNGNAGAHEFVNGVCVDCGAHEASSNPGIYRVPMGAVLYNDNPGSSDVEVLAEGALVVVSEVVPSAYNWYWGITPDGTCLDMMDLDPFLERISGESADETAAAISAEAFERSNYVIIARDDDFADAMAATGLAGTLGAPIVLTGKTGLGEAAADEVERLGATRAYVIGGPGALSEQVGADLEDMGLIVRRIYGEDSYDTSLECAKLIVELGGVPSDAIVAMSTNFQDALSMSSYAYRYKVPIILQTWGATSADRGFTDAAKEFLADRSLLVVGGTGAISNESLAGFDVTTRLWGEDGYETSNEIAKWMVDKGFLKAEAVVIACGAQAPKGVDALAGAALAGRLEAPVLLVNTNAALGGAATATLDDFVTRHASSIDHVYLLGGRYVTPDDIMTTIAALKA